ncbi:ThiF family adenylyltransferase [uncultured Tateyamaria sp.]|uniref:ThiF family adenylyltransferase n=1 Tax=uncultured Tateyamaria sp. TaxID=455651 RepID=UPI0026331663|nr:ThiF family adenylyltransferase [uncultured Tateyamaria sp.]
MYQKPTNLRADVARLIDDGYEVSIEHNHLIMCNVPYVTSAREIKRGTLISPLTGSFSEVARPSDHVIMFSGDYPCDAHGKQLESIRNATRNENVAGQWAINHRFSSKPKRGYYLDYYEKMHTYASILANQAAALDPECTARTFRVIGSTDDSPFQYFDNASGRVGISEVTQKLTKRSIAIVGLGGTGSYVLDYASKTPVDEIHLFDGDIFEQHTAFRCPGAATIEEIMGRPPKVGFLADKYGKMHRGIVPHGEYITEENVAQLEGFDMVFLCIDANEAKVPIVQALESFDSKFIDVGIGVNLVRNGLTATLRTTTSTPENRQHVHDRKRIPMKAAPGNNEYARNIQIAELNAINAGFAIVQWKQECGFYRDTEHELFSLFRVADNHILNEDAA